MKSSFVVFIWIAIAMLLEPPTHCNAKKEWHVHVVNGLSGPPEMLVHCKSKDDDLGGHYLSVGQEVNWGFNVNFWFTTLFFCHVARNSDYDVRFDAFRTDGPISFDIKCEKPPGAKSYDCFWIAKDDGVYLRDFSQNPPVDTLTYKWEKTNGTL